MRLETVFLSVRPIVELLARSTMPSSPTLLSSRRNVQRARPFGGSERARAITARFVIASLGHAVGIARIMQCGWYKEVRVKDLNSHATKALLVSRALLVKIKRDIENQYWGHRPLQESKEP